MSRSPELVSVEYLHKLARDLPRRLATSAHALRMLIDNSKLEVDAISSQLGELRALLLELDVFITQLQELATQANLCAGLLAGSDSEVEQ